MRIAPLAIIATVGSPFLLRRVAARASSLKGTVENRTFIDEDYDEAIIGHRHPGLRLRERRERSAANHPNPRRPTVAATVEEIVKTFPEKWKDLTKKLLGKPDSNPSVLLPAGDPDAAPGGPDGGYVPFLNQGADPDGFGSTSGIPSIATEFASSSVSGGRRWTELLFRAGDRGSSSGGPLRLRPAHLAGNNNGGGGARALGPVPIGSALAYETVGGGLSLWGATDDGEGYKEWIYVPEGEASVDVAVGVYEIEGARFVPKKDDSRSKGMLVVADADGLTWMEVTAPFAYDKDGHELELVLEILDDDDDGSSRLLAVKFVKEPPRDGPLLVDPVWTRGDDMRLGRRLHTATRLHDGRVLVAGGVDEANLLTRSVELYDPISNSWEDRADMPVGTRSAAQVLLDDDRVLITHGAPSNAFAYLYDVAGDSWTEADPSRSMIGGPNTRLGSRVAKLPNGQVLLTGNWCCPGNEAHLYDPASDTFRPVAGMNEHRLAHTLTVLGDGSVLAAGGGTLNPTSLVSDTAELFVPDSSSADPYLDGSWWSVSDMTAGHFDHEAALLRVGPDAGKVLVCAGVDGSNYPSMWFTNVCDLYDPVTRTFSRVADIPNRRQRGGTGNGGDFFATVEAGPYNGSVVAAGGWYSTSATDVYDPHAGTWSSECNLGEPRLRHATVGLLDGSVAVFGGQLGPFSSQSQSRRSAQRLYLDDDDDDCDGIPNDVDICPVGGCGVISGRVYHDRNETCFDDGDFGTGNAMVRADNVAVGDTRYAFSDADGYYSFDLPYGTYEVSLVDSSTIEEIDPTALLCAPFKKTYASVNAFGGRTDLDFALKMNCQGVMALATSGLNGTECNGQPYVTPCPGFGHQFCFAITNQGSGWNNVVLNFPIPAGMTYIGLGDNLCGFTATASTGVVTATLSAGGGGGAIPNGSMCIVCFEVHVNSIPVGGWTTTGTFTGTTGNSPCATDSATYSQQAECGCDPNIKYVNPGGCDAQGTYPGGPLEYTVRFQNEGLGPANDVYVVDQIDDNLKLDSMVIGGLSHPATNIQINEAGKLYVRFDDIALPAAKDDWPGSQGYVEFGLEPATGQNGDRFTNRAVIYFDQQKPVTTNEVVNTIGTCNGGTSHSGLGDGTNPGQGDGRMHSPNGGNANPNNNSP